MSKAAQARPPRPSASLRLAGGRGGPERSRWRAGVFVEAYRWYSADGLFTSRRRYLLKPPGANPRRTPLIGREASPGDNKGRLWMETSYRRRDEKLIGGISLYRFLLFSLRRGLRTWQSLTAPDKSPLKAYS
jgi:hypothetical protein